MKLGKLSKQCFSAFAIIAVALILSGCSGEAKQSPPSKQPEGQKKEAAPAAGKTDVTIGGGGDAVAPLAADKTKTTEGESKEVAVSEPKVPKTDDMVGGSDAFGGSDATTGQESSLFGSAPAALDKDAPGPSMPINPSATPAPPMKVVELGEPLVPNVKELKRLDQEKPLWLDAANKQVVMLGRVCQNECPLEMFACLKDTKEHESAITVDVKAFTVHAALLALGAEPGNTARFIPDYIPAAGPVIEITVVWKGEDGKVKTARAQDWVRNTETGKAMELEFLFVGSGFWVNEDTKEKNYLAEGGDFICVTNFPSAMIDVGGESKQSAGELSYEVFTENVPPRGTPVTIILKPQSKAKPAE